MAEQQRYFSIKEVVRIFGVSESTIYRIEAEGFICSQREEGSRKVFSEEDLERIRLVLALSRDLGVNWAGIEIILHMRERLIEMQRQVDEIFSHLHRQMKERLASEQAAERRVKSLARMDLIKVLEEEGEEFTGEDHQ